MTNRQPTVIQMLYLAIGMLTTISGAGLFVEHLGLCLLGFALLTAASVYRNCHWAPVIVLSIGGLLFCVGRFWYLYGAGAGLLATVAATVMVAAHIAAMMFVDRRLVPAFARRFSCATC